MIAKEFIEYSYGVVDNKENQLKEIREKVCKYLDKGTQKESITLIPKANSIKSINLKNQPSQKKRDRKEKQKHDDNFN